MFSVRVIMLETISVVSKNLNKLFIIFTLISSILSLPLALKILNIKVCVQASFDICRMHCLLLFAHPCGNLFLASRQLV